AHWESARETELDRKSSDRFTDDRHRLGHAADTAASPALRCARGRLFYCSFRNRLRDRWRSAIAGCRPRPSGEIVDVSAAVNETSTPPNVAIVGRPNVGKSALFNRLIGRKSAIVHDQPGITRDRISAICKRAAQPFTLWDTGGIGGAGETELISQVRRTVDTAVRESDILLFLMDAQQGLSPIDEELARSLRKSRKPVLLVINKVDHPKHEDFATDFDSLGFETSVSISAAHGRGIAELLETIDTMLAQTAA